MIKLYVKTHNKTGMKYFGKTIKDPFSYKGSGKYWIRHIKKHGNDVSTELLGEFDSILECEQFALKFSKDNNIVESEEWANLKEENGKDGSPIGVKFSVEHREKIRQSRLGKCHNDFNDETRSKMSASARIRALNLIENNDHKFFGVQGSEFASKRNKKLLDENRHNFQGDRGSLLAKKTNDKMLKNGTHPLLKTGLVSVVDKTGKCHRITKEEYRKLDNDEYVFMQSKEGKRRRKL